MDHISKSLSVSSRQLTNSLMSSEPDDKRMQFLTTAARRLFSQFKTDATIDAKTYLVAVIDVLSHYSDAIVMSVTHPFTGIASKQNWLPTIHEIRCACDAAKEPQRTVSDAVAETLARRADSVDKGPVESRMAHIGRLRKEGKLAFDYDLQKIEGSWWHRFTAADAAEILVRYEREAQRQLTQDEQLL